MGVSKRTKNKSQRRGFFAALFSFTLVFSIFSFALHANKTNNATPVEAADYSGVSSGFHLNNNGSVTATFTVTDNGLSMRGWLLCLFPSQPEVDGNNKLTNSNDAHPYSYNACAAYFFAANTTATGEITVTWNQNAVDQKTSWNASEATGSSPNTLLDYMTNGNNYHLVIGPRHYNTGWGSSGIGAGDDGYWENCDYYVGSLQQVFPELFSLDMTVTATGYTGPGNNMYHTIAVNVTDPASGYVIRYGTTPGNYSQNYPPSFFDPGTYTTYFEICADGYNTYYGSAVIEILETIDMTYSAPSIEATYDGQEHGPTVNVTDPASGYVVTYKVPGDASYSSNVPTFTNAGEYLVYYQITANGYNTVQSSLTITINKADPDYTAPTPIENLVYTGEPLELVSGGSSNIVYSSSYDGLYLSDIPMLIDAGEYRVYYKAVSDGNHYDMDPRYVTVTIHKADAVYTAPTAKEDLVYTGEAQALVNAGSSNVVYSLDNQNFSSTVPTATNAGEYTVYYKVTGDSNHYGVDNSQSVQAFIDKAGAIYTAPRARENLVYTGSAQELVTGGSSNVLYSLDKQNFSKDIPTAVEAGSYYVFYKIEGDANHYDDNDLQWVEVYIDKAEAVYTAPQAIESLAYTGEELALVTGGSSNILYSLDKETFSSDVPTATAAGSYYVFYKVKGDENHYGVDDLQWVEVVIDKAEVVYTAPTAKTDLVYNAEEQELVNAGSSNVLYSLDKETFSSEVPTATDAGSYYVFYKVKGDDNHYGVDDLQWVEVNIAKADASFTTVPSPKLGLAYTGEEQDLINEGSSNGGTVLYSLDNDTFSTNIPKGTNTGIYVVYYMIEGDTNYNGVGFSSFEVTIYGNDKTALNAVILEAKEYFTSISSTYPSIAAKLDNIIATAEAVSDKDDETESQIIEAKNTLLSAFDVAHAEVCDVLIRNIGEVRYSDKCLQDLLKAEEAYAALSDEQKALVKNPQGLTKARELYDKVKVVGEVINQIGEVTYDEECYERIQAAKEAFANLDKEDQMLIPTLFNELNSAEDIYDTLKLISDLGEVTYSEEYKEALEKARKAFDALDYNEQSAISSYQQLLDAEEAYKNVDKVVNFVNEIDEILSYVGTHNSDIEKAREAYNALTPEEKLLVPEHIVRALMSAEETYEELKVEHERKEIADREAGVVIATEGGSGIPDTVSININNSSASETEEDITNNIDYQTIMEEINEDEVISSICEIKFYEERDGEMVEVSLSEIDENMTITIKIDIPEDVDPENFKVVLLDEDNNIIEMEYEYDPETRQAVVKTSKVGTFAIITPAAEETVQKDGLAGAIVLLFFVLLIIVGLGVYSIIREKDKKYQ